MTLLVFGKTGQVARELARLAPEATFLGRKEADLTDPGNCAAALLEIRPSAVINAAAYTAVDRAEDEENMAQLINADAPAAMARAAATLGVPFVHISTDYVFDGSGTAPWHPDDPTAPLGAYGRTKLAGEEAVRKSDATYGILRTSWVVSAHGNNFVKTMRRLGAERDSLNIVADQVGGPTPAADIAHACVQIAASLSDAPSKSGTYHFSGTPSVSWADFAREIFAQSGISCDVTDIPSSSYPTPAQRPHNSRLDCTTTKQAFGITQPDWRMGLAKISKELG